MWKSTYNPIYNKKQKLENNCPLNQNPSLYCWRDYFWKP